MSNKLSDYERLQNITGYCKNLGNYNPNSNYGQMSTRQSAKCNPVLPLSKTKSGINTSTNTTAISCRMKYAQVVNSYGPVQSTTSYAKKTCSLGGPTFSY